MTFRTSIFPAVCIAVMPIAGQLQAQETIESHGISTFGELKYPADFASFDYVNPDAPKGGTMSFRGTSASKTFDSLNPYILQGEPAQGIGRIYDTLLVRAFDEPDALYGLLAEKLTYPEDRSWVIFTLRSEARFADGTSLTADDVVFTIETLKADGSPLYQIILKDVASVEALSDHEVRVDFAEDAETRDLISDIGTIGILPREYYDTRDFKEASLEPPLGSGPYVVDDVDVGRSITYCRNSEYWAAELPVNIGKDNFDCYRYEYFADNTAAFEALKAGVYLFHEEFFSAIWATGYDFPSLENGWVKREVIPDDRPAGAQGFWLNLRRPQFQDRRVREAIGILFNFEWSNETLFYGLYNRTDSFWEGTDMQADGTISPAELAVLEPFRDQLPDSVFADPAYVPPVSTTRKTDRGQLRRANTLLEDAGWFIGDDGMRRNAQGEVLRIEFVDDGPAFERILLPYIENLKLAGIDASVSLIDAAEMEQRQKVFDYDAVIARFVLPLSPSTELRTLFASVSADAEGAFNLSGLEDPVVDALIEQILGADERAALDVHVKALDRVLRDKRFWIPNWFKGSHWIAYWDVFGRPDVKPLYDRGIDYWWWDQAKYDALKSQGAL